MNRIRNVSLFFRIVFQMLFIALPILLIASWMVAPDEKVMLLGFVRLNAIPLPYTNKILHTLSVNEKILGCLISAIPMIVNMLTLYFLIQLFKLYEKADIFSSNHVRYIRNIGYTLLLGQLIHPIYHFTMGIVLTIHNPPHHRFAAITMGQTNIGILLTAILVILISWIMAEGYKLREEQQLTV